VHFKIFLIVFQLFSLFIFYSTAFSEGGLTWERFRFSPKLSLSETYTDNVYLTYRDKQYDLITIVAPQLYFDFAFTPQNVLTLQYDGEFRFYSETDNLKKDKHRIGILESLTTQKGSTFKLGGKAIFDSIQPYSEKDRHKDFMEQEFFADMVVKFKSFTDFGMKYDYLAQHFNNSLDAINEFNRNTITLNITYNRLPAIYPVIEYTFYHQDNNDLSGPSTDFDTHIFLLGAKWDPETKLSGYFKADYYQTKLDNGDKSGGFAMDTDMAYHFSESTKLEMAGFRRLVRSTRAARESGDFYISTGGNLSISNRLIDPLTISMNLSYINNKFNQTDILPLEKRKDNFLSTGLNMKYVIKDWISVMLIYQYRANESNIDIENYKENKAEFRLTLTI
jgi:hypothetical protein